ncbi:TadE/TadG family type IV pilus assembly protein [Undibacter mobilis]|uniref:Pilus assembly protein n=1 Tax=Undibacter mobilis TaxID=2292256 RepID=A0A371BDU3_9BRAD|nr:TadE/TadG family type IV pilus assembly protein [Undibacter mobilis]RDV05772.1 pilus assembly protein [Undibacter mobilis]
MLNRIKNVIGERCGALKRSRLGRRFIKQQDGAAAVEFALVATPFLALIFAIIESAMVFFAGQSLEAATAAAARLILTGQAQTTGYSANDFKTQVCNRVASLFDCSGGVYVDVKTYSNFTSVSSTPPVTNGKLDTSNMTYTPGGPGCIVKVAIYYQWPIYVSLLGNNLSNLNGNKRLLVATSVFRNEPYGGTGGC